MRTCVLAMSIPGYNWIDADWLLMTNLVVAGGLYEGLVRAGTSDVYFYVVLICV